MVDTTKQTRWVRAPNPECQFVKKMLMPNFKRQRWKTETGQPNKQKPTVRKENISTHLTTGPKKTDDQIIIYAMVLV